MIIGNNFKPWDENGPQIDDGDYIIDKGVKIHKDGKKELFIIAIDPDDDYAEPYKVSMVDGVQTRVYLA